MDNGSFFRPEINNLKSANNVLYRRIEFLKENGAENNNERIRRAKIARKHIAKAVGILGGSIEEPIKWKLLNRRKERIRK